MTVEPHYQHGGCRIYQGCCLDVLPKLPEQSVHCCVTSPPYWGLRDYGVDGQIGLESTPEEFIARMVEVFRAVKRVLRDDGTLWLNLGDSYNAYNSNRGPAAGANKNHHEIMPAAGSGLTTTALKPKDLMMMPARVALALQADGWYLRSDIIWHKPNPMPESCTDRPTKSHEHLFLLTKKPRYFYDSEAVRVPLKLSNEEYAKMLKSKSKSKHRRIGSTRDSGAGGKEDGPNAYYEDNEDSLYVPSGANHRDVWTLSLEDWVEIWHEAQRFTDVWKIPTKPTKGAHFATFPKKLVEPCIKAGTSAEGCCPECGAPWERVTEKERVRTRPGKNSKAYDRSTGKTVSDSEEKPWRDRAEIGNRDPGRHVTSTTTTGWAPGCECLIDGYFPQSEPCTVMDIFSGTATTGEVARANGCHYIGIELSKEYIALAAKRLEQGSLF